MRWMRKWSRKEGEWEGKEEKGQKGQGEEGRREKEKEEEGEEEENVAPRFMPEQRSLQRGDGAGGVRVAVVGKHLVSDEVLQEPKGPAQTWEEAGS